MLGMEWVNAQRRKLFEDGLWVGNQTGNIESGGTGGYAMWQYFFFVPLDRPLRLPGAEHPHRLCEDMVFERVSDGGFRSEARALPVL